MLSTKIKCLIAASVAGVFIAGQTAYAVDVLTDVAEGNAEGIYTVSVDGSTMEVDEATLNLKITRGDRVWYSGNRAGEDDGLNVNWRAKIQDAVSVGYFDFSKSTTSQTEMAMSRLSSSVTFTEKENGFDAKINCKDISITFVLEVRLYADKLTATVPYDSIVESKETYKLEYLLVYPFFDSSYGLVDGAMLIPDGSGALIDLSQPTRAKSPYAARIYGDDYGISASPLSVTSPETASAPVFAMMYPDGGTMVTADSGAEYCSVNAQVSSITTQYNLAYYKWIYREKYVKYYESTGTSGKSYTAYQEDKNKFDLVQTMTFLDEGCDSVSVAKAFRENLQFKGVDEGGNAGLRLEFLMAENKQGMFGREVVAMTTASYVGSVASEVNEYCKNLSVSLLGYTNGGLDGSYPNHFSVEGKTGSKSAYKSLSSSLKSNGIELSFVTDFVKAYSNASVADKKLALNISNQFITVNDVRSGSSAKFNLMNIGDAVAQLKKDVDIIKNTYGATVDYNSMGNMLYSGYKNSDFSRSDTISKYSEAITATGVAANMSKPNAYMWSLCDSYLDIPVSDSGYLIETESVPFLQMVLSGNMEIYCKAVNLNYTGEELVLRLIDYNVYPSFTLTEKDAIELYGTNSAGVFTSSYVVWGDTVKEIYEKVNAVLSKVYGATVERRYSAGNGVYVTEYSNGTGVVVNYSDADVQIGADTVKAKTAAALNLG